MSKRIIALTGNPNVGKSTVFNELTGMHQHTGNWIGKTVALETGEFYYKFNDYDVVDLPGTYSLHATSREEEIARDYLLYEKIDCVVCVIDATVLERSLPLVYQIMEITDKIVVVLNLCDQAKKKGISIDSNALQKELGVPVVCATARSGKGINEILEQVHLITTNAVKNKPVLVEYQQPIEKAIKAVCSNFKSCISCRFIALALMEKNEKFDSMFSENTGIDPQDNYMLMQSILKGENILDKYGIAIKDFVFLTSSAIHLKAKNVADATVTVTKKESKNILDKLLLGKFTSIISMMLIFLFLLYLTITFSNYPSELLKNGLDSVELWLGNTLLNAGVNSQVVSLFVNGMLRVLFWVIAVMLPPMAIFFPMFALMEDFGILPRIAFNLDCMFEKCGACGKQALTTCMGIGCNAVGVTGARIIDSPRERIIAIVTNSLTPCNGRFPLLIAVISMFFCDNSIVAALILLSFLMLSLSMTMLSSKVLSKTVLKGYSSSFAMELPDYRKPQILKTILISLKEKVLFVLMRAVVIAAPAGLIIWLLANIQIGDISMLSRLSTALDPIGHFLGLDGVLLLAFILGFPANEIVIPVALMAYLSTSTMSDYSSLDSLREILVNNDWTIKTAICTCIFSMFHFPCSTTLLTTIKETKSFKWSMLSILTPLIVGIVICSIISHIF